MSTIPTRPFYERPWQGPDRAAAQAFWAWHLGLWELAGSGLPEGEVLRSAAAAVREGLAPKLLAPTVEAAALEQARTRGLPLAALADQVEALEDLRPPVRFVDAEAWGGFVDRWAGAHAVLLAGLAGVTAQYQQRYLKELARAFFLTGRLLELPADLAADQLFVPLRDLEQYGVDLATLKAGALNEGGRRLLWKQVVRARDAFSHGLPLVQEVGRRPRRALKQWYAGGLEVLAQIERQDFDVWTHPVQLSRRQQAQVQLLAFFGKGTFKSR